MADKDKNIKKTDASIDKSSFEFVQKENKIYDKKFQTKPIGYFKDAMIRFAKNKTNVIATTILGTLILLSILVPTFSSKNASVLEPQVSQLPPRMPFLENFGIFDGSSDFENIPISYDNPYINPETGEHVDGLYLPNGEYYEYIQEDTLTNYWQGCTDRERTCEGGTIQLAQGLSGKPAGVYATKPVLDDNGDYVLDEDDRVVFETNIISGLFSPSEVVLELQIDSESSRNEDVINNEDDAAFVVYFQVQDDDKTMIKVFDSSDESTYDSYSNGLYTVDFVDHPELSFGTSKYKVILEYGSDNKGSGVVEYFRLSAESNGFNYGDQGPDEDYLIYTEGFEFSRFELVTDIFEGEDRETVYTGNILRIGGQRLNAAYTVESYEKAFGPVDVEGFSGIEYLELIQGCTYADGSPVDPEGETYAEFNEGCPVNILYQRNTDDAVTVPGKGTFYTYDIQLNYRVYAGYDEIPYFLFGTSAAGYDMVKIIWIGLRTSLLIGLFVSAINIAIGVVYGAISGYYGGQVDIIMQRFAEIIGRIPWLVTLSIFMAYFEAGFTSLILILIVSGWIGVASITRTQFYRYKGREYVLASRTLGAKDGRLIFRHILPNGIGTIITSSILLIPTVIFSEATLSYLGFGIGHGQSFSLFGIDELTLSGVSIGVLLNDGRNKLRNYPHLTIFPAIIISILMITFNMFGNALRDAFNPALRGSE